MHQDDEFEEDEDYYHNDNAKNQYEKFFSIDASIWEKYGSWFKELTDGIVEQSNNVWIVYPEYLYDKKSYFVANNSYNSKVYKQYIIIDKLNIEYRAHLISHAKHFLQQPHWYKGLHDILN